MDNEIFKQIADHLRKPEGEMGRQVGLKMNSSNELINKWTIELLAVQPHNNILEIGMGNGSFVGAITAVDETVKYTGIDYSTIMMEEATKRNAAHITNNQAQFILGNASTLPFMPQSFDKVFSVNTIYFWDDVQKVMSEISRILKPEGMLIIAVRPKDVMINYPFTKYGFKMYAKQELTELLNKQGFEVTNILEKDEPDEEINGKIIKTSSLIIVSRNEIQKEQRRNE